MPPVSRKNSDSYQQTMNDMRSELTPRLGVASRLIHHPLLEGILTLLDTLLRPRALLLAAALACLATTGTYLLTVLHNFSPSGSESLIAFVSGWIVGLVIDGFIRISRPDSRA